MVRKTSQRPPVACLARPRLLVEDLDGLALPSWDEDGLTLALDAALELVDRTGLDPSTLQAVDALLPPGHEDGAEETLRAALGVPDVELTIHGVDGPESLSEALTATASDGSARGAEGPVLQLVGIAPTSASGGRPAHGAVGLALFHGVTPERGIPGGPVEDALAGMGAPTRVLLATFLSEASISRAIVAPVAQRAVELDEALRHARLVAPREDLPDDPMGAFVPPGTWSEDLPARLRPTAQACPVCDVVQYPPRARCRACGGAKLDEVVLDGPITVHTRTRIGAGGAPSEYALEQQEVGAFDVAVVEWEDHGVKVMARLCGTEQGDLPPIGTQVRPRVRRLFRQQGVDRYGLKFEPS